MELAPALLVSMPNTLPGSGGTEHLSAPVDDTATIDHHQPKAAGHFADILGQTLAGPLFATWTPTADIIATSKPVAGQALTALDANGRREGRKRSRR
jgi:hypothetical protein